MTISRHVAAAAPGMGVRSGAGAITSYSTTGTTGAGSRAGTRTVAPARLSGRRKNSLSAPARTSTPAATSSATTVDSASSPSFGASMASARCSRSPRMRRIQPVHCAPGPCSRNTRTPSCQARSTTAGKSTGETASSVSASAADSSVGWYHWPVAPR
jgi:hypothetical protein